jgi:hypothetical protein
MTINVVPKWQSLSLGRNLMEIHMQYVLKKGMADGNWGLEKIE